MDKDLFPWIGGVPIKDITAPLLWHTLPLRTMGYSNDDTTPHGFRAMARTIMVEQLNVHPDVIEAAGRTCPGCHCLTSK